MVQVLTMAANHPFWVWAALAAALLGSEALTGSGWLLWPATCAAIMAVLTMVFPLDPLQAMGLFAAMTIASTYLGRRFIPQLAGHDDRDINDAAGRLIGIMARRLASLPVGPGGSSSTARNGLPRQMMSWIFRRGPPWKF